jgi:hypothetical protein
MNPFPITMILLFVESTITNVLVPDLDLECGNIKLQLDHRHHSLVAMAIINCPGLSSMFGGK